jgi:hypothetical protein
MGTSKSQRTILTEDGELRHVDTETDDQAATPEARLSAVFCTNCGTANHASSHFCRTCGQSLDEQVVNPASLDDYAPPAWKNKRSADQASAAAGKVIVQVATLIVMGILFIVSIALEQLWIALVVLGVGGWLIFFQMARHGA